jgi:hypothetical protein
MTPWLCVRLGRIVFWLCFRVWGERIKKKDVANALGATIALFECQERRNEKQDTASLYSSRV